MVSRYFDVQLEDYLLRHSQRHDRAKGAEYKAEAQYHETQGKGTEREWLTITGVVADALMDSQEIIYTAYQSSDGSFRGATILQVQKQSRETRLIHREPQVVLEKLKGKNCKRLGESKSKTMKAEKARETQYGRVTDSNPKWVQGVEAS